MGIQETEIQRDSLTAEEALERLFDLESPWSRKGVAFINVAYLGTKGGRYGSSKHVHKDCLEGRTYELSRCGVSPWGIYLLFTDEKFNPRVNYKTPMRSLNVKTS